MKEHLSEVARRAAEFADPFGAGDEPSLPGSFTTLGDTGFSGAPAEPGELAWIIGPPGHGSHCRIRRGRLLLRSRSRGHRVGARRVIGPLFARWRPGRLQAMHPLGLKLTEAATEPLRLCFQSDGLRLPQVAKPLCSVAQMVTAAAMLDVRMLYSALVDADFFGHRAPLPCGTASRATVAARTRAGAGTGPRHRSQTTERILNSGFAEGPIGAR